VAAPVLYFVGGEDSDFTSTGAVSIDTTYFHHRMSYSRCALQANDGDSFWNTGNVMSVADVWVHARVWMTHVGNTNSPGGTAVERAPIKITDAAGIVRLILYGTASSGIIDNALASNWTFGKVTAAGAVTQIGSPLSAIFTGSPASSPDQIDIQIANYAGAGSGAVNIWVNGVLALAVTGQTLATDSNTTLNGVRFAGGNPIAKAYAISYSEVILSDSDTRFMDLATLTPAGSGNTDTFDIGVVSDINELVLSDATLNA
jgi:hypothetical protein